METKSQNHSQYLAISDQEKHEEEKYKLQESGQEEEEDNNNLSQEELTKSRFWINFMEKLPYILTAIFIGALIIIIFYNSNKVLDTFSSLVDWASNHYIKSAFLVIFLTIILTILFVPMVIYFIPLGYAFMQAFTH